MKPRIRTAALALFAVLFVSAVLVTLFGDNLRKLHGMSADSLSGDVLVASRVQYGAPDALERKSLRTFGEYEGAEVPAPALAEQHAPAPNPVTDTRVDALSTFAIDVDTASYSLARRTLGEGRRPAPETVRVEEWVNAFQYQLPAPKDEPFAVHVEGAPSPFREGRTLLKVALQGRVVANSDRRPAHLVFLVDTSCSMSSGDRLPLAQRSMEVLLENLNARDTVAIATYAGSTQVVLEPTSAANPGTIRAAINSLRNGGGTAMASGMSLAYGLAARTAAPGSVSRVLVFTDGDANIGATTPEAMLASVRSAVQDGVTLTTVGFGMGNYRDGLLERLANSGNGQALYLDGLPEAQRVFGRQLSSTLEVIARDVKVQVAFDPDAVQSYRLVGYENRDVADAAFRDDTVDGGELGAGHSVTALYEVELHAGARRLGTVSVRGQHPDGRGAFEVTQTLSTEQLSPSMDRGSADLRFATAVALAADVLRGNARATDWPLSRIEALASGAAQGVSEREAFVQLLRVASSLPAHDGRWVQHRSAY